ncbi:sulfatase [Winogradskyella sp. J14-2]|uniref:formylglycine-generating enzyme family protein n=1 Tax=Winogradskyella sp. J14-2 TaxID=1936080 RepID=UPI000972C688|nr:formylglycine-generating enzyme family protein [Winogradskyella sp. J14-2]APY07524.1 sulfatase [Winogradskyella sp. J14-2]
MKKILIIFTALFLSSCKDQKINKETSLPSTLETPKGMVWVPKKTFIMGAKKGDRYAMDREKPGHTVTVDGFFIDITEVTNAQFRTFVEETGYITIAEKPIDWEALKKDLPPGTTKPADSLLQPGSLVFNKNVNTIVDMNNYSQWWTWKIGANWKHPYGPDSSIEGKDNFPVVHVAYQDALEYCKWANRRLPTEAEWEAAAQGTHKDAIYTWGNDGSKLTAKANTWQGIFPVDNNSEDGFEYISQVKSYAPNALGIYDMIGNVWEMTADKYNVNYYKTLNPDNILINPQGAHTYYNPQSPFTEDQIMKGGSFLCHSSYCASYRISARMATSKDTGSDHLGFRTVASPTR